MYKSIFIFLAILILAGCGPSKRASKMEIDFNRRDSLLIEQVKYLLKSNVSVITDLSRKTTTKYKDSVNPVTGKQLVDEVTVIDNNIVAKDSSKVVAGEKTNVAAGDEVVVKGSEEIKEEKGMSGIARTLVWIGIGAIFVGIVTILKRFKII